MTAPRVPGADEHPSGRWTMKPMPRRKAVLLAGLLLAAAAFLAAEPALDEVVQAGRFVFFRDHADPHRYYYVPDAPRLATQRDGTPEFTFIKYTKTGGATKGGIVHFLVTWGYSGAEMSTAESILQSKDPQARIDGPVPFKEGTFRVISATAGEGGLFTRRIVGEGKAPILPGQKAAVSIALTEEGATLLWESFQNPTSDISVQFIMKFTGVTPAFQAKLKVNWDKVYQQHDIRLHAEAQLKVVKLEADVRAILEELRQQGAIQLDVVGENQDMQKMLDAVYTHLLSMMCEKVPTGADAGTPPAKKAPGALAGGPVESLAALEDLVLANRERLRRGPFWPQVTQDTFPCAAAAKARWEEANSLAMDRFAQQEYRAAAEKFKAALEACETAPTLYLVALCYDQLQCFDEALPYYKKYVQAMGDKASPDKDKAMERIPAIEAGEELVRRAREKSSGGDCAGAAELYMRHFDSMDALRSLYEAAAAYDKQGRAVNDKALLQKAAETFQRFIEGVVRIDFLANDTPMTVQAAQAAKFVDELTGLLQAAPSASGAAPAATSSNTEAERRARRQAAQQAHVQAADPAGTGNPVGTGVKGQQATSPGAAPSSQSQSGSSSSTQVQPKPKTGTTSGQNPPAKPGDKPGAMPPAKPGEKPAEKPGATTETSLGIKVQLGYTFKQIKLSGNYEVDMRKRLREDREMVMSGNVGGIYQKYGEDRRFFSIISLDDPTFEERTIEVILDGQDAQDFKDYVNSVSVLFRKERFSGPIMTGEVKFFEQQFADRGNRLSFKYGRLNEASTEWLDYEYRPKWSLYGGVEWEGDWTKTSDSVLTLSPPCRRRTLEISVDEDNIIKNGIKALAIQVRHRIFGRDITKEVVIDYDKGDPLQTRYTYLYENGSPGYSYKVIWLLTDGREVQTAWLPRESPFIFAVYAPK